MILTSKTKYKVNIPINLFLNYKSLYMNFLIGNELKEEQILTIFLNESKTEVPKF